MDEQSHKQSGTPPAINAPDELDDEAWPEMPLYPGTPTPTLPGYPTYAGVPSTPMTAPMTAPLPLRVTYGPAPRPSRLARPIPAGVSLLLAMSTVLIAAVVFSLAEVVAHADWAGGAHAAGLAALALAGVTLAILFVRLVAGRRTRSTVALGAALAIVLTSAGVSGIVLANPLHGIQARALEQKGDWAGAAYEYELAGEHAPAAPDVARVYDEWGEQLAQQQQYKAAVADFTTVVTRFAQSGTPVDRAQNDLFNTYTAWVRSGDPAVSYGDAISVIVSYRSVPSCDESCQYNAQAVEAQARFQYGLQLDAQQRFAAAVEQFDIVQTRFPNSPYASQSYQSAAQAYWGLGQQQIQGTCTDALPTYQTLAKGYGDTPEGQQAKAALAAPQSVSGTITGFTDPTRVVFLSRSVSVGTGYFSASDDYHATVDSRGEFTFSRVAQGSYNLSAASYIAGNVINYPYWVGRSGNLYFVRVGPLCPTQIGALPFQ